MGIVVSKLCFPLECILKILKRVAACAFPYNFLLESRCLRRNIAYIMCTLRDVHNVFVMRIPTLITLWAVRRVVCVGGWYDTTVLVRFVPVYTIALRIIYYKWVCWKNIFGCIVRQAEDIVEWVGWSFHRLCSILVIPVLNNFVTQILFC